MSISKANGSKPRRNLASAMLIGLLIATPISFASAAGGGGGGGGAPSSSTPRYDPAQEYRDGLTALDAGDYDAAVDHFKRVTRVARRNADAQYLLGVSYLRAGEARRARRPLESAVRYAPEMIIAHRDLAITYIELEREDDAQEILDTLTARRAECGEACAEKVGLDEAIAAINSAMAGEVQASYGPNTTLLADATNADRIYYQAVGLINDGEYEAALLSLDEAALAFGPHPDIMTYQGFANRKLAKFERAEAYYNRALAVAPNHLGAIEYYGELKVERGDLEGAREHLARLENLCAFGCYEAEELRAWIDNANL
ncbi:tetratricopeptide repeat protein [Erythrobacter sp. Alg231-14]|uniref:tetratricopeptide repeat protein n=1 Tax=Erythrobacter sp. Alg231-14 TaxID=1922225 RepID=UPI000D559E0F